MKSNRAFTLTEFLVAASIFAMFIGGLAVVVTHSRNAIETANISSTLQEELHNALDIMVLELRQTQESKIVSGPVSADGIWHNEISFAKPFDFDSDGDVLNAVDRLEWSNQAPLPWVVRYFLDSGQLKRSCENNSQYTIANNVISVGFKRVSSQPSLIQISITGRRVTFFNRPIEISLTNQVNMRN